jgi:hypothetical protein
MSQEPSRRKFLKWTVPVVTAVMLPVSSFAANSSGAAVGRHHEHGHEPKHLKKSFKHLFQHERD